MTEQQRLDILTYVFDLLHDSAERYDEFGAERDGCNYCGEEGCTLEKPCCDTMKARRARRELDRLISPPLESLQQSRLRNPAERIYHEVWQRLNVRSPGLNKGYTLLEWILCPEGQRYPSAVSHRDAQVATSVIQYLGTNGGRGLIEQAERQIERERAERSTLERDAINLSSESHPRLDEWAKMIAGRCIPVTHFGIAPLEEVLRLALYKAYDAGARHADNFVTGTA
jgi:hypothetical protein